MEMVQFRSMNTDVFLNAEGESSSVARGFAEARRFIEDSERRFTRFSADSELSQLNHSAGSWFPASPELVFVVMLAREFVDQTNGLFDPSILPDLNRIGYDRSMDLIRDMGSTVDDSLFPTRRRLPLDGLIINPDENLIYLPEGVQLDLGGIAKGWIAEQAAAILGEFSSACAVNAGGDMVLVGLPEGKTMWEITLEDPRMPDLPMTRLNVPPGAVATSSITRRIWNQAGKKRHHLIDPRTGEPAVTDWLSVTVLAPHADMAEVFAKALLIAGSQVAESIARNASLISYLAVDREGKIWGTKESLEYVYGN
jgi:thiamine biosynthesis lipoprotein